MEHALVTFFVELVLWLDRLAVKPLRKVVPNLEELSGEPGKALAGAEVHIGPSRRYASALVLGSLGAVAGWAASVPLLVALNPFGRGWPPWAGVAVLLAGGLGIWLASVLLMLRLFRGGTAVLRADGVEFRYRKKVVWCPWALFDTPGAPFRPGRDRVLLPVAEEAVPFVEARRDEAVLARGVEVRTRQLRFKSAGQAVLKALYEVDVEELGAFLLGLGRRLRRPVPDSPAGPSEVPAETAFAGPPAQDGEGWITVRLTRLVLPPFCCHCGTHTTSREAVTGYASVLRVGRLLDVQGEPSVAIPVPVCPACRRANRRVWRRAFGRRLAAGLLVPLLLGLVASLAFRHPGPLGLALPLAVLGAVLGGWSGVRAARRLTAPAQVRYSPREGAVALRFREPRYAEAVLALLQDPPGWRPRTAG
jgi:hypothetical protein